MRIFLGNFFPLFSEKVCIEIFSLSLAPIRRCLSLPFRLFIRSRIFFSLQNSFDKTFGVLKISKNKKNPWREFVYSIFDKYNQRKIRLESESVFFFFVLSEKNFAFIRTIGTIFFFFWNLESFGAIFFLCKKKV